MDFSAGRKCRGITSAWNGRHLAFGDPPPLTREAVSQVEMGRRERLIKALRGAGVKTSVEPFIVASESNEVWRVGDLFVRICYRGDKERLLREAELATVLPREVGYPEIVAMGRDEDFCWMVTRSIDATPVSSDWSLLGADVRFRIGKRLGELLKIVHNVAVPKGIDSRPGLDIVGEDRLPLPIPRTRALLGGLVSTRRIDSSLARNISRRLDEVEHLDPFAVPGVIIHGDAGVENLLWREGLVVGLLDFEWVRSGQVWVDVLPIVNVDIDLARGLSTVYPEPFSLPDASECIYLLELANALRTAALWKTSKNIDQLRELTLSDARLFAEKLHELHA